jgi:AraC-like DNA-binding protein
LLRGGDDLSLAQVAARSGFGDQGHFTGHFQRLVGSPPSGFDDRPARLDRLKPVSGPLILGSVSRGLAAGQRARSAGDRVGRQLPGRRAARPARAGRETPRPTAPPDPARRSWNRMSAAGNRR